MTQPDPAHSTRIGRQVRTPAGVAARRVPDRDGGQSTIPAQPWHRSAGTSEQQIFQVRAALPGDHNRELLLELGFEAYYGAQLCTLSALVGGPAKVGDLVELGAAEPRF